MDALPYQEPPLGTLLPLIAFLLALHIVAWPLDRFFSAGLLGQIAVGIIWGPLASWIELDVQSAIVQLGYIGLILLVYEGKLFICSG
jgi:Kef-type K+ transport system membrane component KefB